MTQDNSKLTTICTKTTDYLNRLVCWLKTIWHWLKGLRIASNSVPIVDEEPTFQIPATAKTREAIEAYVDQYVKDSIAWQEREFQKWKLENITLPLHDPSRVKQRRRQVWKWSAVSFSMLCFLVYSGILPISQRLQEILIFERLPDFWFSAPPVKDLPNTPLFFSIVALLITAPIAYAIWTIRDENAAQTLENARKDTNLKDFQRLSEWASGFHLPEDKIVSLSKTISKETETTTETSTTTETYSPPRDTQQVSRRMGAESLQVAAIYQLQAFMRGAYGEQFMKPAFHLLHSIWEGLMQPFLPENPYDPSLTFDDYYLIYGEDVHNEIYHDIARFRREPICKALNKVLFDDGGKTLRLFRDSLNGLCLVGIKASGLNLTNLNFKSCDLRFSDLSYLNAQGTIFEDCNFSGGLIRHANLQLSSMSFSRFVFATTQYLDAEFADFSKCSFRCSQILSSSLDYANLQSGTFQETQMSTVDLLGTDLRHTINTPRIKEGVRISSETDFGNDSHTGHGRANAEDCRKQWLKAGAILVDSDTGEPIDPP